MPFHLYQECNNSSSAQTGRDLVQALRKIKEKALDLSHKDTPKVGLKKVAANESQTTQDKTIVTEAQ